MLEATDSATAVGLSILFQTSPMLLLGTWAGALADRLLSTVFAAGTVVGGLLAAQWRELTVRVLLGAAVVRSVLQMLSGYASELLLFGAVLLPIAAAAVIIDSAMGARVQLASAEDMRGRVLAAQSSVGAGAGALGGPLVGWMSEAMGPALALHLSGLVSAVATVAVAAALVRTRRGARPVAEPEALCERLDPVWVIPQPRGGPAIKLVPAPA